MTAVFDPEIWGQVPYHFWTAVFFVFGTLVGSFLNVCIHRMPREESLVRPPSHCPHCGYSIPWYLNIPLVTWVYLKGRCRNCAAPISARYFLVELLTGVVFMACWLKFGWHSMMLPVAYCVLLSGFIVATFIDFEHFIIPDEITLGGIGVGFVFSFLVPALHWETSVGEALKQSILGAVVGAGLVYGILRGGKVLFGRRKVHLAPGSTIYFTETSVLLPDVEIPYEDVFYRKSDTIVLHARRAELIDRCYADVPVRLSPAKLQIGDEVFEPEQTPFLEVMTDGVTLPREAMGLGDVKFMAAIGAFLGWQATVFSLMVSSMIGAAIGGGLILMRKREWSSRIPYGPYIALAATIWIFGGKEWVWDAFGW